MNTGIDIVEVERFEHILQDEVKMKNIFTDKEIAYFNKFNVNKLEHLAGFFSAKEAFAKALKEGFSKNVLPINIEILHYDSGAPFINLLGKTKTFFEESGFKNIELNISHTNKTAIAICILY